jgi:dihydrofolate reductase
MILSLIAAMSQNRAIGARGGIPWKMPGDLARFKAMTLGKPILMGRKTFDSIGRPLPGRPNLVVSRSVREVLGGEVFSSIDAALVRAAQLGDEVMVIGGEQIFSALLPRAERVYLTTIDLEVPQADTFFPALNPAEWVATSSASFPANEKDPHACTLTTWSRSAP